VVTICGNVVPVIPLARALQRIRLSKFLVPFLSILIYAPLMGYWITPRYFVDFRADPRIIQSSEVAEAIRTPRFIMGSADQVVVVPYNPMINVTVLLYIESTEKQGFTGHLADARAFLRVDNFILYTGTWLGITLVLTLLGPFPFRPAGLEFKIGTISTEPELVLSPSTVPIEESPKKSVAVTTEEFLAADVSAALSQAKELYSRSTLMLAGGVIMAFIGVGIFYVSLPQFQQGEDRWTYLEKGIRPTGMLVFVEGMAWFLLRQYRALIEDYKAFHRLYLKRANYLVALKTLSATEISPSQMFLAATMISEDLTGRLKTGETTENLEGVKAIEPNPVFTLFQSLVESIKKK